ncbi:mitochondrial CIV assembly protein Pet100F (fungal type) [Andalucia godoyi]|uniref:Mitochondrial CIV assembly protein Pet100F (Fungal type) n=1 Tax=Andalucia godoyi TaxID=505711 RepID=A0A8K0AHN1_ANDGO|nr:mitochondrial CIV assembly protein Pet100F (fungal type) [Andalucia godoyi]|eukprot:ANDGO_00950.mRNA.1 mitochondrial CIV assembly protein Pet100F (fungal type)
MGGKLLEAFKFTVYVGVPIFAVAYIAAPQFLDKVLLNRQYVVYPKEGERPPPTRDSVLQRASEVSKS